VNVRKVWHQEGTTLGVRGRGPFGGEKVWKDFLCNGSSFRTPGHLPGDSKEAFQGWVDVAGARVG